MSSLLAVIVARGVPGDEENKKAALRGGCV